MTKTIQKFKLENVIEMPKGAEILTVQSIDRLDVFIWALVDPENETEKRMFAVIGTGDKFDSTNKKYIGTYQQLSVWHLFEIIL